jgi:hypothetical protein
VLWLIQDAGRGRALLLHSDGAQVFRRPKATTKPRMLRKTSHHVQSQVRLMCAQPSQGELLDQLASETVN